MSSGSNLVSAKTIGLVSSSPFNNFFTVEDGRAVDQGNERPKGADPSDQNNFVLVIENKGGSNKVKNISAATPMEARQKAKNAALQVPSARVVILARRVGTLKGKPLFKDIVGFKPKTASGSSI